MRCGTVLEDIIGSGEGKTVEFKQDIPKDVMRYIPTVVAFSNTIGGTMIFGVSDSGEVTGIEEGLVKDRIEEISYAIGSWIEPP